MEAESPEIPTTWHSLRLSDLPLGMRMYREEDDVLVWETTITELPVAVEVPALGEHGPCWVEMEYGDGSTIEEHPNAG
jgi:hypothetical protein